MSFPRLKPVENSGLSIVRLLGLLVLSLGSCTNQRPTTEVEVFPVIRPGRATDDVQREYVGEIQAVSRAEVRSRIKGRIEALFIDEGRPVKAGALLFSVSARELQHELRQARAAVASAVAELKAVELDRDNTKMLLEKSVIAPAEMRLIESKVQLLQARLEEARAHEAHVAVNLSYTEIRAPFGGVVNRLPNKVGSLVDEGTLLTTLTNTAEVYVYFRVSEQEYLEYSSGTQASQPRKIGLQLANGDLFPLKGVIDATENEIDRNTGTIAFRARFSNPDGRLKHGGSGKILIGTSVENALTIPQKSTFEIQDHVYVYVVDGEGIAHARRIVPRLRMGDVFVVESGLEPDEQVIAEGAQKIQDGAHVAIRSTRYSGRPL